MRKMIWLTLLILGTAFATFQSFAKPAASQNSTRAAQKLKAEMNHMLITISELVTDKNGGDRYDNTLNIEQGHKILASLDRLRAIDKAQAYTKDFDKLGALTQKLILAAQKNDPKVSQYSQDVYAVCFQCHQTHGQ